MQRSLWMFVRRNTVKPSAFFHMRSLLSGTSGTSWVSLSQLGRQMWKQAPFYTYAEGEHGTEKTEESVIYRKQF